jgi:hypothetical protein
MGRQVSRQLEERVLDILKREGGFKMTYRAMAAEIGCTSQAVNCAIKQLMARDAIPQEMLQARRPRGGYGKLHHQIVDFVERFVRNTGGIKPTVRQIADWFDVDVKTVYYHIRTSGLQEKVDMRRRERRV